MVITDDKATKKPAATIAAAALAKAGRGAAEVLTAGTIARMMAPQGQGKAGGMKPTDKTAVTAAPAGNDAVGDKAPADTGISAALLMTNPFAANKDINNTAQGDENTPTNLATTVADQQKAMADLAAQIANGEIDGDTAIDRLSDLTEGQIKNVDEIDAQEDQIDPDGLSAPKEYRGTFGGLPYEPHTPVPHTPTAPLNGPDAKQINGPDAKPTPSAPKQAIGAPSHAPRVILDPSKRREARFSLMDAIDSTAQHYGPMAGMSAASFAKVLDAMASIESRYGVALSVVGTRFPSSASGPLHFLNSTAYTEANQQIADMHFAGLMQRLGVKVSDGISRKEVITVKHDNAAAAAMVADDIVKAARANPQLVKDPVALAAYVYMGHNLGAHGRHLLLTGGREALDRFDPRITANNPMFFKTDDPVGAYRKHVESYMNAAQSLRADLGRPAGGTVAPATVVARLEGPAPSF